MSLTGNRLLDLLPQGESSLLLSSSQAVSLPHGLEVFRDNGPMPYVYFPTKGVFGIVIFLEGGKQVEAATVGREGMLGLPVFLGLEFHPFTAVSQTSSEAWRVPAAVFVQASQPGSTLDRLLRRYSLFRLRCENQTGVCNSLHSVQERLCRWLLMTQDRAGQNEFLLTHEFLAELLGVRRQTVSIIAGALQRAGLISYHRGVLRVLDREGLGGAACECYTATGQLYERIMRSGYAAR
jgi:CRP-like cAMP-binding protein